MIEVTDKDSNEGHRIHHFSIFSVEASDNNNSRPPFILPDAGISVLNNFEAKFPRQANKCRMWDDVGCRC